MTTAQGNQCCNLSLGDIEARLDPGHVMRVHRSHVINLRAVRQLQRDDGCPAMQLNGLAGPVAVSRSSAPEWLERLGLAGGSTVVARQ